MVRKTAAALVLALAATAGPGMGAQPAGAAVPGTQLWASRYDGPGNGHDFAASVTVSPGGDTVFATGGSVGSGSATDYATVAYSG